MIFFFFFYGFLIEYNMITGFDSIIHVAQSALGFHLAFLLFLVELSQSNVQNTEAVIYSLGDVCLLLDSNCCK